MPNIRKLAILGLIAMTPLSLSGCGGPNKNASAVHPTLTASPSASGTPMPSASPTPTLPASTSDTENANSPALRWAEQTPPDSAERIADWPNADNRTIRTYRLGQPSGAEVIVYAKQEDADYLYAAYSGNGSVYDLGKIAGIAYDKKGDVTIEEQVSLFHQKVVKLTGAVGASAAYTLYFSIDDGIPKPLLRIDTGLARELDLDFDGSDEIVASSGLPINSYVYRWNRDRVEVSDLNEALGAASVTLSPERAIEASNERDGLVKLYWYSPAQLRSFAQYTMEEYTSDTFVSIPYEQQELSAIKKGADRIGVSKPYVAARGIATDYGLQISADANGVMQITYPHFSIRQSKHELKPKDGVTKQRKVVLNDGPAYWIETDGNGAWYLQRGATHLSVSTAKPYDADQLLFVVASLIPWQDQKATSIEP